MERLMYLVLSYNPEINEKTGEFELSLLKRTVPTAMIYTTGDTEEGAEAFKEALDVNRQFLENIYGYNETLFSYHTYQFRDYSKYDVMEGVKESREKQRDEQFPKDLENAYKLGKRLVVKAKEFKE